MSNIETAIDILKDEYQKQLRDFLREQADSVFGKYPVLESIQIEFYTPFWNDGEECMFRVNCDYPRINGLDETEFERKYDNGPEILKTVKQFLRDFNYEDFFKDAFGDHVELTITRNEFKVEEYDHE